MQLNQTHVQIIVIVLLALLAVRGEINEMKDNGGYSSCDCSKITDLDPSPGESVQDMLLNIRDAMEVYKGNVVWRKAMILSLAICVTYCSLTCGWGNFLNFVLLFFIIFFFTIHIIMYTTHHSFLPICRIIKNNLRQIQKDLKPQASI